MGDGVTTLDETKLMPRAPEAGQIVRVRQRQYFVEEVVPRAAGHDATLVRMSCLDDDASSGDTISNSEKLSMVSPERQGVDRGPERRFCPR